MNFIHILKKAAAAVSEILLWAARHLGAVFFFIGTLGIIGGISALAMGKSVLFATLLIVVSLILWGIDAYFVSTTKFLPFALLIIIWEIAYIALYYIFVGFSEPQKILWLYVSMIALLLFTKIGDSNIRSAASISLYLYGVAILMAILLLQIQGRTIGAGLLGEGIQLLGKAAKEQIAKVRFINELVTPILDTITSNSTLEYYLYAFVMLYWLSKDRNTEIVVEGERLPRILAAYTLIIFGFFAVIGGIFATLNLGPDLLAEQVVKQAIYHVLFIGMGLLILLYGVSVVRGYRVLSESARPSKEKSDFSDDTSVERVKSEEVEEVEEMEKEEDKEPSPDSTPATSSVANSGENPQDEEPAHAPP